MRRPGSIPSRRIPLARSVNRTLAVGIAAALLALGAARAEPLLPYRIDGDAIAASLTGRPGDPERGHALVLNRQTTCVLCHPAPLAADHAQGDLAPDLAGAGDRWSAGQLRLRLVDPSRLNPATIMPSYYRIDALQRVAPAWLGKPILSAEQIEDIIAYLATLTNKERKDPP